MHLKTQQYASAFQYLSAAVNMEPQFAEYGNTRREDVFLGAMQENPPFFFSTFFGCVLTMAYTPISCPIGWIARLQVIHAARLGAGLPRRPPKLDHGSQLRHHSWII